MKFHVFDVEKNICLQIFTNNWSVLCQRITFPGCVQIRKFSLHNYLLGVSAVDKCVTIFKIRNTALPSGECKANLYTFLLICSITLHSHNIKAMTLTLKPFLYTNRHCNAFKTLLDLG